MWMIYRSVVLDKAAEQAVDNYSNAIERFSDAFQGLEWLLARRPDKGVGKNVSGTHYRLYCQASDELANTPEIWVLYEYDDENVFIRRIAAYAKARQ